MRYIIGKALERPFQRYIACGKFPLITGLNSYFMGKKCLYSPKITHKIKNLDPFWVETCRMRYIIGKALERPFQRYIACGKFPLITGLNSYFMGKKCLYSPKIAHKIKNLDPFWVETCRMRYIIGKALKRPFQRYIACGKFLLTMGLNSYFMCKQMSVFT